MIRVRLAFYSLTLTGISTLIGAFANPLQKLEVWSQPEYGAFGKAYNKKFLLRQSDRDYPLGFDRQRAVKVAQVYLDSKESKIALCLTSLFSSGAALLIGGRFVSKCDLNKEVGRINQLSQEQLQLRQAKHNAALAAKSQELLHQYEVEEFISEFGNPAGEDAEVEERLAADPFTRCLFLVQDGLSESEAVAMVWECPQGTPKHAEQLKKYLQWLGEDDERITIDRVDFRSEFPEAMDTSARKAIYKALGDGATEDEIVREVLGCCASKEPLGRAYLQYLKSKT
ncbi:MAG: hypothetical protein F6J89_04125 [Symploca sp. SIO1C4]|uniref:Uncharacterized protein n=1 Tax=Symploca sp. SIO1C4 TaxID=2607765 RepID=A0A6B3N880_9CYAN|nr:hypothetical protein [Symploca sp. SIO1C4]